MSYKKSVVIIGADGFIGSHLTKYLVGHEISVYAIIMKNSPLRERINGLEGVNIVEADLRDGALIVNLLPREPIALFHLAWNGVSPEARNSISVQQSNLELCMDAVRIAAAVKAQRFILPGSTMEYAYCGQEINATALPSPQNAYGAAKIEARFLCEAMCEELSVPYIYAVISGIYSADRRDGNVIYYTIEKLLQRERPVYTKLEQLWDYIHIDDVVRAFYLIALKGRGGAFYSIGHGDNWPLANYIFLIRDIIDSNLPLGIGELPYKNGKLPSSCVDLTAIKADTGFVPTIPFDVGIKAVIESVKGTNKV